MAHFVSPRSGPRRELSCVSYPQLVYGIHEKKNHNYANRSTQVQRFDHGMLNRVGIFPVVSG